MLRAPLVRADCPEKDSFEGNLGLDVLHNSTVGLDHPYQSSQVLRRGLDGVKSFPNRTRSRYGAFSPLTQNVAIRLIRNDLLG